MSRLDDINNDKTEAKAEETQPQPTVTTQPQPQPAVATGSVQHNAATAQDAGQTSVQPVQPVQQEGRRMTLADISQMLKTYDDEMARNKPETDEERARREKKERRNKMFAALGDGISALSSLFFATKGAPATYDPSKGLSTMLRQRYDKALQAREAQREAYLRAAQNKYTLLDNEDTRAAKWAEMARKKQEHDWQRELQPGKVREVEAKAKTAEAEANHAEDYYTAKANVAKSQADKNNRQGTSGWVSGSRGGSKSGGSKSKAKWAVYGPDGRVARYVQTRDEAVFETARIGGRYPSTDSVSESTNAYGETTRTHTVRTPTVTHPAPKPAPKPAAKPAPKPAAKPKPKSSYKNTKALGY